MSAEDEIQFYLSDAEATERFGGEFFEHCQRGIVYLEGDLGVGKTCFSRALIRQAGFSGRVKSPTYTLVEPYELETLNIYHFDLYRLEDEEELIFLGCDEYFETQNLCLIEWPQKAEGVLPSADIRINIRYRQNEDGQAARELKCIAVSEWGREVLRSLEIMQSSYKELKN